MDAAANPMAIPSAVIASGLPAVLNVPAAGGGIHAAASGTPTVLNASIACPTPGRPASVAYVAVGGTGRHRCTFTAVVRVSLGGVKASNARVTSGSVTAITSGQGDIFCSQALVNNITLECPCGAPAQSSHSSGLPGVGLNGAPLHRHGVITTLPPPRLSATDTTTRTVHTARLSGRQGLVDNRTSSTRTWSMSLARRQLQPRHQMIRPWMRPRTRLLSEIGGVKQASQRGAGTVARRYLAAALLGPLLIPKTSSSAAADCKTTSAACARSRYNPAAAPRPPSSPAHLRLSLLTYHIASIVYIFFSPRTKWSSRYSSDAAARLAAVGRRSGSILMCIMGSSPAEHIGRASSLRARPGGAVCSSCFSPDC
ncbi:hypothetical protein V8E36_007404 [Tilletia maclaganii]